MFTKVIDSDTSRVIYLVISIPVELQYSSQDGHATLYVHVLHVSCQERDFKVRNTRCQRRH